VFADIVPGTHLVDHADVERRITARTRAIIAVHLYGELADMLPLKALAEHYNLKLIEDACQAHGASRDGMRAGTIGDFGCLSFYPTKNLGTVGEGGMVLTANEHLAARVASLRDHGQRSRHHHVEPGYNGRMSELQASALRVFLPHLRRWNEQRVCLARRYAIGLRETHVQLPRLPGAGEHVFHLYVVETAHRDELQKHLANRGINTAIHYPTPIHMQPAYRQHGSGAGSLPVTETTVARILSLPMHPEMTAGEVDAVCRAIREFDVHRGIAPRTLVEVGS
jgi:dTDP-4-amino-4,6-dideoxygalactose transaminase